MDYMNILGITPDMKDEDVKKRYKVLCRTYHPDNAGNSDMFVKIQQAYKEYCDKGIVNKGSYIDTLIHGKDIFHFVYGKTTVTRGDIKQSILKHTDIFHFSST